MSKGRVDRFIWIYLCIKFEITSLIIILCSWNVRGEGTCSCKNKVSGAFYSCSVPVSTYVDVKRFLIVDALKATWFEALGHCRSINMHLGVVYDSKDRKELTSTVLKNIPYWVSGTRLVDDSDFVWLSSGLEVRAHGDFWKDRTKGSANCLTFTSEGFSASDCYSKFGFICQQYDA